MPAAAQPHIIAAEKSFMDPQQDIDEAHRSAIEYVTALPEGMEGHAGVLKKTFHHKAAQIPTLTGPRPVQEQDYLKGKLTGIALKVGFYTGDLKTDWRN